ncbi:MAG: hypothetical protein SGILL_006388 [Bacillariaceae sp.]
MITDEKASSQRTAGIPVLWISKGAEPTEVLLCGCGNAVHVLTSLLGSKTHLFRVRVLSLSHADRLIHATDPKKGGAIRCIGDQGEVTVGQPSKVSCNPEDVVPGCKVIIFALPADRHEKYLCAMRQYIQPGTLIGSMPGEGGFDLCVRNTLGQKLADQSTMFTLETLPWACRIPENGFGKVVQILGTKKDIDMSVHPGALCWKVRDLLQTMIGPYPVIHTSPTNNMLGDSLMNPNAIAHPTILYGLLRNWDGKTPFKKPPLFYQAVDDFTSETMVAVSEEILEVKEAILERYPNVDLSEVRSIHDMFEEAYSDDIADHSTLARMFNTNRGYDGLTMPHTVVKTKSGKDGYLPQLDHRYLSEDLPCGILVQKGIAELAGVPTPVMDKVIKWCQEKSHNEFLVDEKLVGKDVASTRAPQRYGFVDLDSFMRSNGYA